LNQNLLSSSSLIVGDQPTSSTSRIIGPSRSFGGFSYTASTTTTSNIAGTSILSSSSSSKFDDIFRIQQHATATPTATTDNRSSAIANPKMTPQSPTLQASVSSEYDEFAAVPPTEPNITQLSSGEVEGAVAAEADQSSISLGDVDASHISAASHNHTVVIPNAPVSRNLTDAFESCEGVLSTPSSTTSAAGDANNANAGVVEGDAGDGSSPAGVEQLDIEGLSIKDSSNAKTNKHQQKRSGSVLKTPRPAAQAALNKTCPSPKISILGETIPFSLHPVLTLDLPATTVNRVSFYSIIHDINKESSDMAANDPSADAGRRSRSSSVSCNSAAGSMSTISATSNNVGDHPVNEELSPLIIAVNGPPPGPPLAPTMSKLSTATTAASSTLSASSSAIIDEEKWLLRAISSRSVSEVENAGGSCPTFAQAIGEQDSITTDDNSSTGGNQQAPNPMTDLSQSRTQLWKPSRSWWEAKSGKNPWIEPNSHNKRWRYLWPLIHYHKFLAKCIKKLKRNGVDVKHSVSPVAAFLRSEVCAVSDHLARCSYFSSEEWMGALYFFEGWADASSEAEFALRTLIHKQDLRPLGEQADTESPLLRDQIDVRFLKAMAAARAKQPPSGAIAIAASAAIAAGRSPIGRPPKAPGGGLPRPGGPGGRPPVPSISTAGQQQKQPGSSRKRRGRRGGRGSSRGSDNDLSLSSHSRASSFGGGDDEEGAAWNGIPSSSPSPQPSNYGDPGDMQLMHGGGGGNNGYGQMPPPYGNPYGMSYGHNPYYGHPPPPHHHHNGMGMAPPMGQHGPPGFYGHHTNPHWAGQGPPPGYGQPPPYPMHGDPNMSMDSSFHGPPGMMMPPHPPVPGTPDQSLDHGNGMDISMASPAWAHLDRLATGVIATPMTNRTAKQPGGGPRANIKNAVAGAARSLVFGDGNTAAAKEKGGVPPSPATMFAASKSPAPTTTNPADVTTTTVDIPSVARSSPAPSVAASSAPSDEASEAPSSN